MPELISLADAKAAGLSRYFTGNPCKHGHVVERRVKSRCCVGCSAIRNKKHYWDNRETALSNNAAWHEAHKEERSDYDKKRRERIGDKLRSQSKAWNKANPESMREVGRRYRINNAERLRLERLKRYSEGGWKRIKEHYLANRDEILARWKKWYSLHRPENAARAQLYRARLKNAPGSHTGDDIRKMLEDQKYKCASCSTSIRDAFHTDHIIPLSGGGSNWISNIQLLCPPCNLSKRDRSPIDWARRNGRLI